LISRLTLTPVRWLAAVWLLVAMAACSGGSSSPTPSSPTALAPPPASRTTVVATLTDTATGQSLGTATQEVAGLPARIQYTSSGYITRSVWVTSARPAVDLIADALPFSLDFYRLFVRGGIEGRALEVIRRWTRAPSVFIKTVDESGAAMPAVLLDTVEQTVRETAPLYTGGRFGIATVERGTGTREGQAGWITIKWPTDATEDVCGRATVGPDGGYIEFLYKRGGTCSCGALATRPRTIRHELGHSFGYWHTDSTGDLMSEKGVAGCDGMLSERERFHAAIAYSRPAGNRDVDVDPATTLNTTSFRNPPPVVITD
jgi:hypothetical protein